MNENVKVDKENIISVRFQFILMVITSLVVFGLMLKTLYSFNCSDPYPEIDSISPEMMEKIENRAALVKVGLNIHNFDEFNMETSNFIFNGTIFFEFDPLVISLEKIKKFNFHRGEILSMILAHVKVENDLAVAIFHIKVKFRTNLNYTMFPVDDHRVSLKLDHDFLSPYDMIYEVSVSKFAIPEHIYIPGWTIFNKYVSSGYFLNKLEKDDPAKDIYHTRAVFVIDCIRNSFKDIVSIIFPLILLFFIAIFSFSIDPVDNYSTIIGFSLGSITGMLSYKYVIEKFSPKVGYFTIADYIFFLLLILAIILFLINSQIFKVSLREKKIIAVLMHFTIISVFTYLICFL